MRTASKIISYPGELPEVSGKKVLVGGCFDIVHFGHVKFLEEAKKQGDLLYVLLESDEFIETYKKRKPFHSQKERAYVLSQLISVDYVVTIPLLTSDTEYHDVIEKIHPAVIAVTEDDRKLDLKRKHAESVGATIATVTPQLLSFSSSTILKYASILRD